MRTQVSTQRRCSGIPLSGRCISYPVPCLWAAKLSLWCSGRHFSLSILNLDLSNSLLPGINLEIQHPRKPLIETLFAFPGILPDGRLGCPAILSKKEGLLGRLQTRVMHCTIHHDNYNHKLLKLVCKMVNRRPCAPSWCPFPLAALTCYLP